MIGIYTVVVVVLVLLSYAGVFTLGRRFQDEIRNDNCIKRIDRENLTRSRLG